jgi:HlyD family secretion protein
MPAEAAAPKAEPAAPKKFDRRKLIPIGLVLLAALALLWWLNRTRSAPANILAVTGRLESDDSSISAKIGGRVREISVREGDHVKTGQILAILVDDQVRAREVQAEYALKQSQARVLVSQRQVAVAREVWEQSRLAVGQARLDSAGKFQQARQQVSQALATAQQSRTKAESARAQIRVLEQQLWQNRVGVPQSQLDAQGRVLQARKQVAAASAEQSRAEATAGQAHADALRYLYMVERGAVARQLYEQQATNDRVQHEAAISAHKQLEAAQGALLVAISTQADLAGWEAAVAQADASSEAARGNLTATESILANPAVRRSQELAAKEQLALAQDELKAAKATALQAKARALETHDDLSDLQVVAPFDGIVATRVAEPGEVVNPGTTLVTLLDLKRVYLRAFVPEGDIGRIKVGQAARVYLDSAPRTPVEAYVSRIDPELSFTPENTYFQNDRVKQVVGIKLQLTGAEGFAKPGMPADGDVLASGQWTDWR